MTGRGDLQGIGLALTVCLAFAVFLTWPQVEMLSSHVALHQDPPFSMWRIAWIAHALATDPRELFNANIFYPARNTLAFSDATFLEGVLAAPFLWAGVKVATVYNIELLGAIALSGVGMFVLVRHLTASIPAALVAATIFTLPTYRIEHFAHLELQWTMWVPLTWWAVHRVMERATWRRGLVCGLCLWLQVISCVYYGVFLAITVAALVIALAALHPAQGARALVPFAVAAAVSAILTAPYMWPYMHAARELGPRGEFEIAHYSARVTSYLASSSTNYVWGWTDARFGGDETRLFPGLLACLLAAAALFSPSRRRVIAYLVVTLIAFDMSLGVNGLLYPTVVSHVGALKGLRSLSRFAILTSAGLAVLAAFGYRRIEEHLTGMNRRVVLAVVVIALMCVEYANRPLDLRGVPDPRTIPLSRVLRTSPPGVIAEFPMPLPAALPGPEIEYEYWSTSHWRPMVNGYSGYYPPAYIDLIGDMRTFPDLRTIRRLQSMGVKYVIVHRQMFEKIDDYSRMMTRIAGYPADLTPYGHYRDGVGEADLFQLR